MHLIFDFDGTIVDSFDCVIKKFMMLADEFHFRKISDEEIVSLKDFSSRDIIKHLKIPVYKLPYVIMRVREYLRNEMHTLSPIAEVPAVLKELHGAGFSLGILTSNSAENVESWLKQQDLYALFNFIRIESKFFSKKQTLKKIIKKYQLEKNQVFYIGDETRDVEAAQKNQIQSIAVTWGYNSEKALQVSKPSFIAKKPADILSIVTSIV